MYTVDEVRGQNVALALSNASYDESIKLAKNGFLYGGAVIVYLLVDLLLFGLVDGMTEKYANKLGANKKTPYCMKIYNLNASELNLNALAKLDPSKFTIKTFDNDDDLGPLERFDKPISRLDRGLYLTHALTIEDSVSKVKLIN